MTITIRTTFYGPTDFTGARITARGAGHQLTVPYDYAANDPHTDAASALADMLGIKVRRQGGSTRRGYVFDAD